MKKRIALAIAAAAAALMTVSCENASNKQKVINLNALCIQWTAEQLKNTSTAYAAIETAVMDTIWFEPKEWDDPYLAKLQKQEDRYAKALFATDMDVTERAGSAIDSIEQIRQQYIDENRTPGGLLLRHIFKANTQRDTVYLIFDLNKKIIAGESFYSETISCLK